MTTPIFQVENKNYTPVGGEQFQLNGTAKNTAGTAVNISSGYTLAVLVQGNPTEITLTQTPTLNSDGTWSTVISASQSALVPIGARNFLVTLSNDAGTTRSPVQRGSLSTTSITSPSS